MKDWFENLKSNSAFWQFAFLFAFVLLIASHKISVEGMIGVGKS